MIFSDPWTLIRFGELEAAHKLLTADVKQMPRDVPTRMNRGICQLAMADYEGALSDFRQVSMLSPDSDAGALMSGVTLWRLGRLGEAILEWRQGCEATITDAAGGIEAPALLLFAAVRTQDKELEHESTMRLRKRWKSKLAQRWPGPIAGYLLTKVEERAFLINQTFLNPVLEARRQCKTSFWIGIQHLRLSGQDDYVARLQAAIKDESDPELRSIMLEQEYWLAKAEIEHESSPIPN